ncbi:AAA family ATPase, partial [Patescibacteria group bacterium]|nr:AAA family ATPase [Patescibacteria group bacterium]
MLNKLTHEKNHLKQVVSPLKSLLLSIKSEIKNIEDAYADGMKELAHFGSLDDKIEQIKILNNMMKTKNYNYKVQHLLPRYEKQTFSPYFAKIDFLPDSTSTNLESYYIGKYAYFPQDASLQIIDWRSPVASMFYNFQTPQKGASYSFLNRAEESQIVTGEIKDRLNFDIADSKLLALYDNSLRIELLRQKIEQKSGGKLTDIIETIQEEQNKIIRSDPYRVCLIQGTAGSGKTTIAVHRLSYLLYTYKDIKEENVLLLSSSKVLVNYTAKILPELEVLRVERNTLDYFLVKRLKDNKIQIDSSRHVDGKDKNSNIYNSKEFVDALDIHLSKIRDEMFENLQDEPFYEKLNLESYMKSPKFFDCITLMHERFQERYKDLKIEVNSGNFSVEAEVEIIEEALDYFKKIYKKYNPVTIFEEFSTEYLKKSIRINDLNIDLLCAIFYTHSYFSTMDVNNGVLFKQIIVDEAQDMGYLNFKVIKLLGYKNGFTLMGDINQSILGIGSIHAWEDIESIFQKENIDYFNIPISYRNTKQITQFAKNILSKFPEAQFLPQEFDREGEKVQIVPFQTEADIIKRIALEIKQKQKNDDLRAVAIVDCDGDKVSEYSSLLKQQGVEHFVVNEKFENFS